MRRTLVALFLGALCFLGTSPVRADVTDASGTNLQDGDNGGTSGQTGTSASGGTVGGQWAEVRSSGGSSVDAKNRTNDADLESGASTASNDAALQVGQSSVDRDCDTFALGSAIACSGSDVISTDLEDIGATNIQHGDDDLGLTQAANATSGDGVGGQVVGSVAAGTASIRADNAANDVDIETGLTDSANGSSAFVGQSDVNASCFATAIVAAATCTAASAVDVVGAKGAHNVQDGDDAARISQGAGASSGDGVAGQVVGSMSGDDASVDAKNRTDDADVDTGASNAANDASTEVGQSNVGVFCQNLAEFFASVACDASLVVGADVTDASADNVQDGDDDARLAQWSDATSGDGVGGQVVGAVTTWGGDAKVRADNGAGDVDITTGNAGSSNDAPTLAGQSDVVVTCGFDAAVAFATCTAASAVDVESVSAANVQEGDDTVTAVQSAGASSGDGVAGQIAGVASSGDAWLDARNRTDDTDVDTGAGNAANGASTFAGQSTVDARCFERAIVVDESCPGSLVVGADVLDAGGANVQEGDDDSDVSQAASASSGDAVGGQMAAVVAKGAAGLRVANDTNDADATSGIATFTNADSAFVGQAFDSGTITVG